MSDRKRAKKSSAPGSRVMRSPGTTGEVSTGRSLPSAEAPPAEAYVDHVHTPIPHAPYIFYVPVQRQRFYTCATCGCALFVIPTPEEADEFDRVLESQLEESTWPSR